MSNLVPALALSLSLSLGVCLSEQTLHADCYICEPGQARLHRAALRYEIAGDTTIVLRREEDTDE